MEIGYKECINILKNNFILDEVETSIGTGIIMSPKEAFIFSVVTGAGYLDNPIYQFTPKGLMKLFYNAFEYKFVSGIFEHATLKHTPYILSKVKPFLFSGSKVIVPVEIESELKLQSLLNDFYNSVENPTDYIILRIEKSKKGNGMEGFMEYLIAEYFKENGFIVENQIPLAHAIGSPDFAGYQLKGILSALAKKGIMSNRGFHIIELSLLRLFNNSYGIDKMRHENKAVVGEAKTSTRVMQNQINKYLKTGLFDYGIEIHPDKRSPSSPELALFTINPVSFKIEYNFPSKYSKYFESYSRTDYFAWLENYMKFYLIANFDNDELNDFIYNTTSIRKFNQFDLVKFIKSISFEDILSNIEVK